MGQARRARSIAAYFLLFALAIQGITPDAQDLASLNALRLFCPQLADSKSLLDEDESLDEVCGPAELDMYQAIRTLLDSRASASLSFVSTGHRTRMVRWDNFPLPSPLGRNARIGDLIHSLRRLIC
jgi:hypothetical protein